MSVGTLIQTKRMAMGVTQRELAAQIGVTFPYISKIENDRETPSEDLVERFAEVLLLDPDELNLAAGRVPVHVVELLTTDPQRGLELIRKLQEL